MNKKVVKRTFPAKINVLIFLTILLTSTTLFSQPYFPIRQNKLWGAIDSTGTLIIQPQYDKLEVYGKNNNFIVAYKGDSTFLINSKLHFIARTTYATIVEIGEGIFKTRRKSTSLPWFYGLMDSNGKILLESKFCLVNSFNDKVAKVDIYTDSTASDYRDWKKKSGIIDKEGNWVVPPIYDPKHLKFSSEGLVTFYENDKGWGAMDNTGKIVIKPKYSWLGPCKNGYMEYGITGGVKSGLMSRDETIIIPDDGRHVTSYRPESPRDTLVVVHTLQEVKNDFLGYRYIASKIYSIRGDLVFESPFGGECSHQCNGFFGVSNKERKQGMMNSAGTIVIEPHYDVLQFCQKDLKQVCKEKKWGFVNEKGEEVVPCIYDDSEPIDNGLAAIFIGGNWFDYLSPDKHPDVKMGYINKFGRIVWTPSW